MEEKSIDFAKINPGYAELELIHLQRMSYQKAFTELSYDIPSMSSPSSGENYAKVIYYLESKGELPKFDEVAIWIRSKYDDEMKRLNLVSSPFGNDDSWINWDLAKQLYFFFSTDRSGTSNHYRIANPLSDKALRDEIISRHIGWEFWMSGGCEPWKSNPDVFRLLGQREKPPASWALAQLGSLIRSS